MVPVHSDSKTGMDFQQVFGFWKRGILQVSTPLKSVMGLVLAGGLSRRMGGREKAFLPFGDELLLTRTLRRFANQVESVLLSVNGDPARFACFDRSVVQDHRSGCLGPLAGIEAAFLATEAEWMVSVPVDLPFLPLDLVQRLSEAARVQPLPTVAFCGGRIHPVVCLWPRSALAGIQAALDADNRRMMAWFATCSHQVVEFVVESGGVDPFFNVNHPENLVAAVSMAKELESSFGDA